MQQFCLRVAAGELIEGIGVTVGAFHFCLLGRTGDPERALDQGWAGPVRLGGAVGWRQLL